MEELLCQCRQVMIVSGVQGEESIGVETPRNMGVSTLRDIERLMRSRKISIAKGESRLIHCFCLCVYQ